MTAGKLASVALLALALSVGHSGGVAGAAEIAECKQVTCGSASAGSKFELDCGRGGEVLQEIKAYLVYNDGTGGANCSLGDIKNKACGAVDVTSYVETQCSLKEKCEVTYDGAVKDADTAAAAAACPGQRVTLDVTSTCKDSGFDALSVLALAFICLIALSLGTVVNPEDFKVVFREKKIAFGIGMLSQFGFMPLCAFAFCFMLDFPPLRSVGVMLIGMAPGGTTSNLYTHWTKGNVALSIAMSTVSTVAALFMVPLLYFVYVTSTFEKETGVALPYANLFSALFALVIPVPIGMAIRQYNKTKTCGSCCSCCGIPCTKKIHVWIEKIGGILGALFLIAALVVGVRDNPLLFANPGEYWRSWLFGALIQPLGCTFGYCVGRCTRLQRRDIRAISLETGVQSYALMIAVAATSFKGCVRSEVNVFIMVGSFWYVINSAICTIVLRYVLLRFDGDEADEDNQEICICKRGCCGWPVDDTVSPITGYPYMVRELGRDRHDYPGGAAVLPTTRQPGQPDSQGVEMGNLKK